MFFFASDEFRGFLQELGTFYDTLSRHEYSSDINTVESLASRAEDFRECLVIVCDMALRLIPSDPDVDELVETLECLLGNVQDKISTFVSFLESVECTSQTVSMYLPDLSLSVSRRRRVHTGGGRPFIFISRTQLEAFVELGFSFRAIAKMLCVSERTLLRRRTELGLPVGHNMLYSTMDDDELDRLVSGILQTSPDSGCSMLLGSLRSRGVYVQRQRLLDSMRRIDPVGLSLRRRVATYRRTYSVPHPNYLWYVNIKWGYVYADFPGILKGVPPT